MDLFHFISKLTTCDDHNFLYSLNEEDKSEFSSHVVSNFISMDVDYVDLIAIAVKYQNKLSSEQYYKLLSTILPKNEKYFKYLKENNINYNKDNLKKLSEIYNCSLEKAKDYIDLLSTKEIKEIIEEEGLNNNE